MADLKLNLNAETIKDLRARAKRHRRSLNQEIKVILTLAADSFDSGDASNGERKETNPKKKH